MRKVFISASRLSRSFLTQTNSVYDGYFQPQTLVATVSTELELLLVYCRTAAHFTKCVK